MNKLKKVIFIFILLMVVPIFWCANMIIETNNNDQDISLSTKEIPTANANGYLHFYEVGTEYAMLDDSVELNDLDRNEDITLQYDYFIVGTMYDSFIVKNGKERLDNINFYFTDSEEGFISEENSFSLPVNQDELIFDEEVTGVVTLKSTDYKHILKSTSNDYVLKPIWGNEGYKQDDDTFLFANTDYMYTGFEPINLHFLPDTAFSEPDVWFETGVTTSHNYFGTTTSILFNYYLSYNTYATDVWVEVSDIEDKSFVRKYSITEFQEDYDVSEVNWEDNSTYFNFSPSILPDSNDYIGRSKFHLKCGIDWERKDELGVVTNTGSTDTSMSYNPDATTTYLTLYFEDIFINTWFNTSYIEQNKVINLNYEYMANRSEIDFYANYIDLEIDRIEPEDNSVEETMTVELVSKGDDEESYQLNNSGSGSIAIDTSLDSDFFIMNKTYNARIVIRDLRYDHWSFLNYEVVSPEASFTIMEEGTVVEVTDQELNISYNEVNYGDDIILDYELQNFTAPFLIEYRFVFESLDYSKQYSTSITVNDQLTSDKGELVLSYDEYKDYISKDWKGNTYVEYKISNDIDDSLIVEYQSNKEDLSFYHEPIEEDGIHWLLWIIVSVLIIATIVTIVFVSI